MGCVAGSRMRWMTRSRTQGSMAWGRARCTHTHTRERPGPSAQAASSSRQAPRAFFPSMRCPTPPSSSSASPPLPTYSHDTTTTPAKQQSTTARKAQKAHQCHQASHPQAQTARPFVSTEVGTPTPHAPIPTPTPTHPPTHPPLPTPIQKEILRTARRFYWPNDHGESWRDVLRREARKGM